MASRFVLVVATADNCGHCKNLKARWPEMKKAVQDLKMFKIVEIDFKKTTDPLDKKWPADLARYILWFPTFMVFKASEWDNGGRLNGRVLNGEFLDGQLQNKPGAYTSEINSFLAWLKLVTTQEPLAGGPAISSPGFVVEPRRSGPILIPTVGSSSCGLDNLRDYPTY